MLTEGGNLFKILSKKNELQTQVIKLRNEIDILTVKSEIDHESGPRLCVKCGHQVNQS